MGAQPEITNGKSSHEESRASSAATDNDSTEGGCFLLCVLFVVDDVFGSFVFFFFSFIAGCGRSAFVFDCNHETGYCSRINEGGLPTLLSAIKFIENAREGERVRGRKESGRVCVCVWVSIYLIAHDLEFILSCIQFNVRLLAVAADGVVCVFVLLHDSYGGTPLDISSSTSDPTAKPFTRDY